MSVSCGCQKDFHDVTFNLCQGVALIAVRDVDVKEQTDRRLEHQLNGRTSSLYLYNRYEFHNDSHFFNFL